MCSSDLLFSVGLMDPVCPPSTVYAAYNHWGTAAATQSAVRNEIRVYPHNEHEGGGGYQLEAQLDWFAQLFGTRT